MKEDFLAELARLLRGTRRHRERLIAELAAHIEDAVSAEEIAHTPPYDAERRVLDRLGGAEAIARRWNADRRALRGRRHRRLAALAVSIAGAGALGITQYAAGKPQPPPRQPPARTTPDRETCPKQPLRSTGPCVSSSPAAKSTTRAG